MILVSMAENGSIDSPFFPYFTSCPDEGYSLVEIATHERCAHRYLQTAREAKMDITPGLKMEKTLVVGPEHIATHMDSGGVPVYSTPTMVLHMEEVSRLVVEPYLAEGQSTVGALIHVEHLAPTPPGMKVTIRSELIKVEERRLTFAVEAWDEVEKVGQGTHVRVIIDLQRFAQKIARKEAKIDQATSTASEQGASS